MIRVQSGDSCQLEARGAMHGPANAIGLRCPFSAWWLLSPACSIRKTVSALDGAHFAAPLLLMCPANCLPSLESLLCSNAFCSWQATSALHIHPPPPPPLHPPRFPRTRTCTRTQDESPRISALAICEERLFQSALCPHQLWVG